MDRRAGWAIVLTAAWPIAAAAQGPAGPPPAGDWSISAGPGAIVSPRYPGDDGVRVLPIPGLEVEYKRRLFLNGRRGLGVYAVNDRADQLQIGGAIWFRQDRPEDADPARLNGLGDIPTTAQVRLFASKGFGPISLNAVAGRDLGGSKGLTLDLGAGYRVGLGRRTFLNVGPSVSIADDRFARTFFGIMPAQAMRSGRAAYAASGGVYQVGGRAVLVTPVGRRWTAAVFGGYDRLVGDAADSPAVARRGAPSGGFAVTYRFR